MRDYHLKRYYRLRNEAKALLGNRCIDCTSTENLEFDHADPSQKVLEIGKLLTVTLKAFWLEVEKCVLRCHDCHSKRSASSRAIEHGAGVTGKRNCYCDLCKPLKAEYNRNRYRLSRHGKA